jgi:hypothetical protein
MPLSLIKTEQKQKKVAKEQKKERLSGLSKKNVLHLRKRINKK